MHFFYPVTAPHATTQLIPYTEVLKLSYGVITDVFIYIPRGHIGLASLQLLYHEHQLYPLNPGGVYKGNETTIAFKEYQPITVNPFELKARVWNTDDTIDHTFYIGLAMQRPEEMNQAIPASSLAALNDLIGLTIEGD